MALSQDQRLTVVQAADVVVESWRTSNISPVGHQERSSAYYPSTDVRLQQRRKVDQ